MFNKLFITLLYRILRTTFYSTFILTFFAWITQSTRHSELLTYNHIKLHDFVQLTSILCIDIIAFILPISFAISIAMTYKRFRDSQQLVALFSLGGHPRDLLYPILMITAFVVSFLYISHAFISPLAWRNFRNLEYNLKNDIHPPEIEGMIFSNNSFSIFAQHYEKNCCFKNVVIVDTRICNKTVVYKAEIGLIQNKKLYLYNGSRTEVNSVDNTYSSAVFKDYMYNLKDIIDVQRQFTQPNELYLTDLLHPSSKFSQTMQANCKALFHQKILSPLLSIIFALISFGMVVLAPYKRKETFQTVGLSSLAILLIQAIFFWLANAGMKNISYIYVNYFFVISLLLINVKYAFFGRTRQ